MCAKFWCSLFKFARGYSAYVNNRRMPNAEKMLFANSSCGNVGGGGKSGKIPLRHCVWWRNYIKGVVMVEKWKNTKGRQYLSLRKKLCRREEVNYEKQFENVTHSLFNYSRGQKKNLITIRKNIYYIKASLTVLVRSLRRMTATELQQYSFISYMFIYFIYISYIFIYTVRNRR